jgi:hypothetical protein
MGRLVVQPRANKALRHMKGKQVAMSLYLPPQKYWLLKAASRQAGETMQSLARRAIYGYLSDLTRIA